jgi:hypothetical protein
VPLGEGGFLDRDLYPFCSNLTDGKVVAVGNPNSTASNLLALLRTAFLLPTAR